MARSPRLVFALVPAAVLAMAACSSSSSSGSTSSSSSSSSGMAPDYADVIFEGSATPAALTSMLAAKVLDDTTHAAFFDAPKNLAELPPKPIATFQWHDGAMHAAFAPARSLEPVPHASATEKLGVALLDLLAEREARADGPVTTGTGYFLSFRTLDTDEQLFRVFTTKTTFTPSATTWAKIATGQWTKLKITSAAFDANQVSAGPWNGEEIQFCAMKPTGGT